MYKSNIKTLQAVANGRYLDIQFKIYHQRKPYLIELNKYRAESLNGMYNGTHANIESAIESWAESYQGAEIDIPSFKVRIDQSQKKATTQLVINSICDAFGQESEHDEESLKALKKERTKNQKKLRESNLNTLRKSLTQWQQISERDIDYAGHYRKSDLSNLSLSTICLGNTDFRKSTFENSVLIQASFQNCKFNETNFSSAELSKSQFIACDLRACDFSGANLNDINLSGSQYDNDTKFPSSFTPPEDMIWKGKGLSLGIIKRREKRNNKGMSIESFMKNLESNIDSSRLKKSLKMLKAGRFELFCDISDEELVGVIKSQNDPDLVYSCSLNHEGEFSCCTQNLNSCGGLRGKLCKHLLVLAIGLAKNNAIEISTLFDWVDNSSDYKPSLNRDKMSNVLIRYKGAEAGEIDWRPTETVPEDYYLL